MPRFLQASSTPIRKTLDSPKSRSTKRYEALLKEPKLNYLSGDEDDTSSSSPSGNRQHFRFDSMDEVELAIIKPPPPHLPSATPRRKLVDPKSVTSAASESKKSAKSNKSSATPTSTPSKKQPFVRQASTPIRLLKTTIAAHTNNGNNISKKSAAADSTTLSPRNTNIIIAAPVATTPAAKRRQKAAAAKSVASTATNSNSKTHRTLAATTSTMPLKDNRTISDAVSTKTSTTVLAGAATMLKTPTSTRKSSSPKKTRTSKTSTTPKNKSKSGPKTPTATATTPSSAKQKQAPKVEYPASPAKQQVVPSSKIPEKLPGTVACAPAISMANSTMTPSTAASGSIIYNSIPMTRGQSEGTEVSFAMSSRLIGRNSNSKGSSKKKRKDKKNNRESKARSAKVSVTAARTVAAATTAVAATAVVANRTATSATKSSATTPTTGRSKPAPITLNREGTGVTVVVDDEEDAIDVTPAPISTTTTPKRRLQFFTFGSSAAAATPKKAASITTTKAANKRPALHVSTGAEATPATPISGDKKQTPKRALEIATQTATTPNTSMSDSAASSKSDKPSTDTAATPKKRAVEVSTQTSPADTEERTITPSNLRSIAPPPPPPPPPAPKTPNTLQATLMQTLFSRPTPTNAQKTPTAPAVSTSSGKPRSTTPTTSKQQSPTPTISGPPTGSTPRNATPTSSKPRSATPTDRRAVTPGRPRSATPTNRRSLTPNRRATPTNRRSLTPNRPRSATPTNKRPSTPTKPRSATPTNRPTLSTPKGTNNNGRARTPSPTKRQGNGSRVSNNTATPTNRSVTPVKLRTGTPVAKSSLKQTVTPHEPRQSQYSSPTLATTRNGTIKPKSVLRNGKTATAQKIGRSPKIRLALRKSFGASSSHSLNSDVTRPKLVLSDLGASPKLERRKGHVHLPSTTPKYKDTELHPNCQSSVISGNTSQAIETVANTGHLTVASNATPLTPKGRGSKGGALWFLRKPKYHEDNIIPETQTRQRLVPTSAVRQHRWLLEVQMAMEKQKQIRDLAEMVRLEQEKHQRERTRSTNEVSMAPDTVFGETTADGTSYYDYDDEYDWQTTATGNKSGLSGMNDDEASVGSVEILFNWMFCRDVEYAPHPRILAQVEMERDLVQQQEEYARKTSTGPVGMLVDAHSSSDDSGVALVPNVDIRNARRSNEVSLRS